MNSTPLQEALKAQAEKEPRPVRVVEYRGAATAACFADAQLEFAALRSGCGIHDLGFRARLCLTGDDRMRWMNGMVTNNIRDLAAGNGVYAFLLNPQGRILGDMFIYNQGEALAVETDRTQVEKIVATFDHYIIMDDVEVTNLSDQFTAVGLSGPKSSGVLRAAGIENPNMQPLQFLAVQWECQGGSIACTIVRGEDRSRESYEIWLAPAHVKRAWDGLLKAGASPVGSEALEMQRIAAGVALYGADIRERDLPQETEQMRALNFNKGCYVGQEIVERIRSRGNVHRKFAGFLAEGAAQIAAGDKILSGTAGAGEKEVGEITSVAVLRTPSGERTVALGYIRREVGTPGREVTIGAVKAAVIQLPLGSVALVQAEDSLLHHA